MEDFDMPTGTSWEDRGGWVVNALVEDLKITLPQAAGLVGNLGYESRGFEALQEKRPQIAGSAGGAGWAQWTGMRNPNGRRYRFEEWCRAESLEPDSDEANYGFLVAELLDDGPAGYAWFLRRLKTAPTIEAACKLTYEWYERPQEILDGKPVSGQARLKWARRAAIGAQNRLKRG